MQLAESSQAADAEFTSLMIVPWVQTVRAESGPFGLLFTVGMVRPEL